MLFRSDPLSLASVVFDCKLCSGKWYNPDNAGPPPLYPAIIGHECLYKRAQHEDIEDPYERAMIAVSSTNDTLNSHTSWSCESLKVGQWHQRATALILMLGKDPVTATRKEMDSDTDTRLYCANCSRDSELLHHSREVMTWRQAVCTSL